MTPDHWLSLGIHPICFTQSSRDDYSELYKIISCTAKLVRHSVLDGIVRLLRLQKSHLRLLTKKRQILLSTRYEMKQELVYLQNRHLDLNGLIA